MSDVRKRVNSIAEGERAEAQIKRRKDRDWQTLRPVLFGDILLIFLAVGISVYFAPILMGRFRIVDGSSLGRDLWFQYPSFFIVALYSLWLCRAYNWHIRFDANRTIVILARCAGYVALLSGFIGVLLGSAKVGITGMLVGPILAVLVFVGRKASAAVVRDKRRRDPSRLAIVGRSRDIQRILYGDFDKRFPLHRIEVLIITDGKQHSDLPGLDNVNQYDLQATEDISEVISQHVCESVLIASVTEFDDKELRRLAWSVRDINVRLYLEPMLGGISGTRVTSEILGTRTEVLLEGPRFRGANGIQKRLVDIAFSSIVLLALSPIFAVVALAIKLEDGGPIFYKSERIGRYGKPFKMWKFRSMVVDADTKVEQLAKENNIDLRLFKMKKDPRVTKVGRFIRKTSIDEFPQFINSLNGTMSIVGPRPPLRREVEAYSQDMRMRLEVKPGITGLWQVNGRSDLSIEEAENLDLYYADNWSVGLDIAIFVRTFAAVLASRGAY